MEMLWDLYQQRQIGKAQQSADQAISSANRIVDQVATVEHTVESLMLACQAMWELLRDQSNLTDEMLTRKMQEVDLRDGQRDGKIGAHATTCPACSRPNSPRRENCVYCGKPLPPPQHVFA